MIRMLCAGALAGLILAAPLEAQSGRSTSFGITPYAGYMKFGNVLNAPLGTNLRGAAGPVYGAEASVGLLPGLALVANLGYAASDLEVGVPVVGGLAVGRNSALMYDAGVRLSLPRGVGFGLNPFVQAGAGAMRQEVAVGPVESRATNFAYNIAAGVELPLGPRLGLQLLAKDYIGKFDAREATAVDVDTRTTHNWTVVAGLRLGL